MSWDKRLSALEAAQAAAHVPLSDLSGWLLAVLNIVSDEAGAETAGRVAGQLIGQKLRRIEALRGQR